MKPRIETPWGTADYNKEIAPGITFHSTPSHGGFHLDAERMAVVKRIVPTFRSFNDNVGWFEEDCDWSIVAMIWPDLFPADDVEAARQTVKAWKSDLFDALEAARLRCAPLTKEPQERETISPEEKLKQFDGPRFAATYEETLAIIDIVKRAAQLGLSLDCMLCMDLDALHSNVCPMDFDALLRADDLNFAHDVAGIFRHWNRQTYQLDGGFWPRFALTDKKPTTTQEAA